MPHWTPFQPWHLGTTEVGLPQNRCQCFIISCLQKFADVLWGLRGTQKNSIPFVLAPKRDRRYFASFVELGLPGFASHDLPDQMWETAIAWGDQFIEKRTWYWCLDALLTSFSWVDQFVDKRIMI